MLPLFVAARMPILTASESAEHVRRIEVCVQTGDRLPRRRATCRDEKESLSDGWRRTSHARGDKNK